MSRTDKTLPYRIWDEQNPNGWNRNYFDMMYLFKRPKREQVYRAKANGKERNYLRKHIREQLKLSFEDVENYDFQSFPHRHGALWDTF